MEINSQKNVAINVERQSYHLDSIIDIQFSYLFGIAAYMGERKEMFSRENKRLIQSIVKEQDLDYFLQQWSEKVGENQKVF